MKALLFLLLTLPCWADFRVTVTGLKNKQGHVRLIIFDDTGKKGFPSDHTKARHRLSVPASSAKNGSVTFLIKEKKLPPCAFVALHDENSNRKADKNFIGIPKEGVAISNRVSVPPRFKKARMTSPSSPLVIKLKYW